LVKLLAHTESPWDNEALLAIREANRILGNASATWGTIFLRLISKELESEDKDVGAEMNAEQVIVSTVQWLVGEGKLDQKTGAELVASFRRTIRSRDQGRNATLIRKAREICGFEKGPLDSLEEVGDGRY
jgi:hypothetical protein